MGCPRKRKSCKQVFIKYYDDGRHYLCFGISNRKNPGGVRMDCIRHCIRTHYHKKPLCTECTPDEAQIMVVGYGYSVHEWLDAFEPFNKWREENDG